MDEPAEVHLAEHMGEIYLEAVEIMSRDDAKARRVFSPYFDEVDPVQNPFIFSFFLVLNTLLEQYVQMAELDFDLVVPQFVSHDVQPSLVGLEDMRRSGKLAPREIDKSHLQILSPRKMAQKGTSNKKKGSKRKKNRTRHKSHTKNVGDKKCGPASSCSESDSEDEHGSDDAQLSEGEPAPTVGSESVPDSVSSEELFNAIMSTLSELFPDRSRDDLLSRLEASDKIEYLIDALFAEQERSTVHKYWAEAHHLQEIFPDQSIEVLVLELNAKDGSLEEVTNGLLLGNWEGQPEKLQLEKKTFSAWASFSEDSQKLSNVTGLLVVRTSSYLHQKEGKYIDALVSIIKCHKPVEPRSTKPDKTPSRIPRGGRVQRGNGTRSYPQGNRGSKAHTDPYYRFDPNSTEARELRAIYLANPAMKEVNEVFVNTALEFFKGNVDATVAVLMAVIEHGAEALTNDEAAEGVVADLARLEVGPKSSGSWSLAVGGSKRPTTAPLLKERYIRMYNVLRQQMLKSGTKGAAGSQGLLKESRRQYWLAIAAADGHKQQMVEAALRTLSLDLHGLPVQSAKEATREVLSEWWAYETEQRHHHGQLSKYGATTVFAGPMRVITGKGIHSRNGISPVRVLIRQLLDRERYVYEDEGGCYTVYGKRR